MKRVWIGNIFCIAALAAAICLGPAAGPTLAEDGLMTDSNRPSEKPGPRGEDPFAKDDTNKDGKVSRTEFSGPADLFKHMDADGDGFITREEARPKNRGGGPGGAPGTGPGGREG